ncbi:DUF6600 domain-containing protein [Dokdonella sp.]|uniref:DUF6600 domain-containing protein n=1 Tax=Dokdonella sp. TaxID=2291710 RepID=UPI003C561C6E
MSILRPTLPVPWLVVSMIALLGMSSHVLADPPMRVARTSYVSGEVSMQPAGLDEWTQALVNRPLSTGDALYLDRASLAELDIGAASIRINERTSLRILDLDDQRAQIELTAGTLSLTVRNVYEGQYYEIDTPTLAFVAEQPGVYRVDISPTGDSTMISVIDGNGIVYGRDNASYSVDDGRSYRFYDSSLDDYQVLGLPEQDDFDRWCLQRAQRYDQSQSRRYVSEDVIGYSDLDEYGSWGTAATYGSIWYPTRVDAGWAPYRNGHWAWIDPWGWTWVDNSPWGFAPFHYGRWAYVGSRWGWVPGPRRVRPVYAPALVAFVGGGGFGVGISTGPVGWFPLGPRDVYVPWYQGSRNYFNNINVRNTTIINNTYITNVYNDYSRGRPITNGNYAYRNNDSAYTAVPRDAFVNAQSVERARVRVNRSELQQAQVVSRMQIAPTARSFAGGSAARGNGGARVRTADFDRSVIARTAPPARKPDAQARIQAISRNENQPLAANEMRELSARKPRTSEKGGARVQVVGNSRDVGARAKPLPATSPAQAQGRPTRTAAGRNPASPEPARKPVATEVKDRPVPSRPTPQPRPVADGTKGSDFSPNREKPAQRTNPAPAPRSEVPARAPVQQKVVTSPRSKPVGTVREQPAQPPQAQGRSNTQPKPATRYEPAQRVPQPSKPREVEQRPTVQPRQVQKQPATPQPQKREVQPRQVQTQPAPPVQKREVQTRPTPQPRQIQQQPAPQPQQGRQAQPQRPPAQAAPQRQERKPSKSDSDDDNDSKNERKQRGN